MRFLAAGDFAMIVRGGEEHAHSYCLRSIAGSEEVFVGVESSCCGGCHGVLMGCECACCVFDDERRRRTTETSANFRLTGFGSI